MYDPSVYKNLPYQVREPYPGEIDYFSKNPTVAGMKTEDSKIILNQGSGLTPEQLEAVRQNEAIRLHMDSLGMTPNINLTDTQQSSFAGTPYEADTENAKKTLIARILTNDQSAGEVTPEQKAFADTIYEAISNIKQRPMIEGRKTQ